MVGSARPDAYVGRLNPLMMRWASSAFGTYSVFAVMIGNRMETDFVSCIEADRSAILVLSGLAGRAPAETFQYVPTRIVQQPT